MEILLNSIALEPNRWTENQVPYFRLESLLEPIAGAGFDKVEIWQNHVATLSENEVHGLRDRAEELGVSFPVIGMYPAFHLAGDDRKKEIERFDEMLARARTLDTGIIKLFAGSLSSQASSAEQWQRSVGFVKEILDRSERTDVSFTLELHGGTLADSPESLLRFMDDVGSERVGVCWQPYDFADTEAALELYDRLRQRVRHLHLQGRSGDKMQLLEESDIDWERVLTHILAGGFDGIACIEFVRDCIVDSPEKLQLDTVLLNAARDREFVLALALHDRST